MFKVIKENPLFFIVFIIYVLIGIVLLFNTDQGDVILFFSENRSAIADFFFKYGTKLGEELVYVIFFILFLFYRYRYSILVGITGSLVSITSYFSKEFFRHPRPKVFFKENGIFENINTVDGVALYNAYTSFPSGHTMSAFALYGMIAFIIPKKYIGLFLIVIAIIIGTSRIYLVQHFVKDVVAGSIMGVLIAMGIYYVQSLIKIDSKQWFDQSITFKREKKVV